MLFIFFLMNTFQDSIRHVTLNVYFNTRPGQFELDWKAIGSLSYVFPAVKNVYPEQESDYSLSFINTRTHLNGIKHGTFILKSFSVCNKYRG